MWLAVTYTTCLYAYLAFNPGSPTTDRDMTMVRGDTQPWHGLKPFLLLVYTILFLHFFHPPFSRALPPLTSIPQAVLYGVWPVLTVGIFATAFYHVYRMKAAQKFLDPNIDRARLKRVHRFSSPGGRHTGSGTHAQMRSMQGQAKSRPFTILTPKASGNCFVRSTSKPAILCLQMRSSSCLGPCASSTWTA